MTLAEFAYLIDADAKWVLNTTKALDRRGPYTMRLARQLAFARIMHFQIGIELKSAFAWARQLQGVSGDGMTPVMQSDDVVVTVDAYRLHAAFNVRRAAAREYFGARVRGRAPPTGVRGAWRPGCSSDGGSRSSDWS